MLLEVHRSISNCHSDASDRDSGPRRRAIGDWLDGWDSEVLDRLYEVPG